MISMRLIYYYVEAKLGWFFDFFLMGLIFFVWWVCHKFGRVVSNQFSCRLSCWQQLVVGTKFSPSFSLVLFDWASFLNQILATYLPPIHCCHRHQSSPPSSPQYPALLPKTPVFLAWLVPLVTTTVSPILHDLSTAVTTMVGTTHD